MADMQAINYTRPKAMSTDGRAAYIWDRVSVTSLTTADTMSWRCPAGLEIVTMQLEADDVESTTASLFRIGYLKFKAADTLTAVDNYFAAAGQTLLQAGGLLQCRFVPIKFDVETIIQLTLNTGGTLAAGGFATLKIGGNMIGAPS